MYVPIERERGNKKKIRKTNCSFKKVYRTEQELN